MRELIKKTETEFELHTVDDEQKLETRKSYTKQELKEIYRSLQTQTAQAGMQIAQLKKQIESLGDGLDTPEIIELADKLELAQKRLKRKKIETQLEAATKDGEMAQSQADEIKLAVPEVERMPKK